jgi:hypothetical protein
MEAADHFHWCRNSLLERVRQVHHSAPAFRPARHADGTIMVYSQAGGKEAL